MVMNTNFRPSIMAPAITARSRQKQKNANAAVPIKPDLNHTTDESDHLRGQKEKQNKNQQIKQNTWHDIPQKSSNWMKNSFKKGERGGSTSK